MANNTIFDDVFRTMIEKMPELTIPLINEVFGTDYPADIPIIQLRNEHQTKNGERIKDSSLQIGNKLYHIECQSTEDSDMVIRMVEYDFMVALENIQKKDGEYYMEFPVSCVLYLRGKNEAKMLKINLLMADGTRVVYQVPVVRAETFTLDDIFQKKLIFLLPYYIIRYEKSKDSLEENNEVLQGMLEEYKEIESYLEQELLDQGKEKAYRDLIELISRIADYIFADREKIKEGIGDIMGGNVLELESDRLIRKGLEQGLERGREQGIERGICVLIETYRENHFPEDKLKKQLMEKFELTETEALEYMKKY